MRLIMLICLFVGISIFSRAQEETSVLFIGNSFTFMNNMPFIFRDIAVSKGKKVHVDTVVEGGKNLEYHAAQEETYRLIRSRKWDYIVLQAHSNELAQPDSKVDQNTLPYARRIVDSIRVLNPCAQLILYMTWGYRYGNPKWSAISTYDSMQYRISNQYLRFADLLDARVSPVGEAWRTVRTQQPGINMYDSDNFHPNLSGSYLSACTFFASVFGESPLRNTANVELSDQVRQIMEYTASQTVLNNLPKWRFVPKDPPVKASFDLVLQNDSLQVINRSSGYTFLEWKFGDGHLSSEVNPSHQFAEKGVYDITLKLSHYCHEVTETRRIEIR